MTIASLKKSFKQKADAEKAKIMNRFFKTGPGEYGYGSKFLGIPVPEIRKFAKLHQQLPQEDIEVLLQSIYNEERTLGLVILVHQFKKRKKGSLKKRFSISMSKIVNL